ncbi:hypothetical protein L3049_14205 [Labilibaculum sp. DW002]|uniref:BRCT domain-containing protein n=1 Tax=Paralabilibaculum antarcticum TaxID=2912572 RepID=A0ABT5VUP8_9BACT|nr:hypothetical protein [Labilibaculum sp. DW002]MDE5419149.1 hypothetical protein [Labilibaculum sp. DW002]
MCIIKIQINHTKNLNEDLLASLLYDEIGEEYGLDDYYFEDYIEVINVNQIPNGSFISIFTLDFPEIDLRDLEPKDIVKSYLDTLNALDEVISVVKLHDGYLQGLADRYFNKLFAIEMELRNVLTYILTYDDKTIDKEIFKDFGVQLAESYNKNNVSNNYENGLYYILFNHYASFGEPKKLKADKIAEILQDVSLSDFQEFKNRLQRRYISEERHTEFLFSIMYKLKPLEDIRNSVMHIRNLSETKMSNFDKAINDNDTDKGIETLITEFWSNENDVLKESTWLSLAKIELDNYEINIQDDKWLIISHEDEDFEDLEEVKTFIFDELKDRVELNDFDPECKEQIDNWIDEKLVPVQ